MESVRIGYTDGRVLIRMQIRSLIELTKKSIRSSDELDHYCPNEDIYLLRMNLKKDIIFLQKLEDLERRMLEL